MSRRLPVLLLLALLGIGGVARPAAAAINCGLGVTTLNFGNSLNLTSGSAVDSTAHASLTCTGGAAFTSYIFCIDLYHGSNASGTQRYLALGSGATLPYDLYSDAAYSVAWGSWPAAYLSGGYQTVASSDGSGGLSQDLTVYGQIASGQEGAPSGTYSDSLPGGTAQEMQYAVNDGASGNTACPLTGAGVAVSQFSFSATATVAANCNVQSGSLTFTSSPILSTDIDSTGSVSVQCSSSTPYSVGLDTGMHAAGDQRRMYSSATGAYIGYDLYTDSGYSYGWKSTTSAASCTGGANTCYLGTGDGSYQNVTIYGRVPPQTSPASGNYADSVTVTVTY